MRYVEAAGVRMSAIGLGTWQFGSREWGYGPEYASDTARQLVHRALELGVDLIDTAEIYGTGRSERIVGDALHDRRDRAFIATKVFPIMPISPVVQWRGVQSAQRLRVDHIDLYQVHWPNPIVPVPATMRGMRALLDTGLVRHVGVSNFPTEWWRRAERSLRWPVLSNQVQYSLACRKPDRDGGAVPYAQQHDRIVIAYSPLAQGLLGGRYDVDHPPSGSARAGNPLFLRENLEGASGLITALREVARTHDATPAQVALAWVIRRPNVVAIPGASSVEQLERNCEAADLDLTDAEDALLTHESDNFKPLTGVAAVPAMLAARRAAQSPSTDQPVVDDSLSSSAASAASSMRAEQPAISTGGTNSSTS
jgi:aryl-alcohol dehydrogenase-like predicted oxidoreductase